MVVEHSMRTTVSVSQTTKERRLKGYVVAVLVAMLLTPSFPTLSGLPSVRLDDVLLLLAPVYVAVVVGRIIIDVRVFVLFVITWWIALSILWGAVLGFGAALGDLFVIVRLMKYVGAVVLASTLVSVCGSRDDALDWFLERFVLVGIALGLIVVQQYYDLLGLNASYVSLVAPTQYETLVGGYPWPRPVGMIGNPNELGFLLGLLGLSSLWLFLVHETRAATWSVLVACYVTLMLLTLSRSATLSIVIGAMVLLFLVVVRGPIQIDGVPHPRRLRMKVFAIVLLAGVAARVAVSTTGVIDSFLWRYSTELAITAAETRVSYWGENLEIINRSPVFGVGTLKHDGGLQYAADNEWILLMRMGGVLLPVLVAILFLIGMFRGGGPFGRLSRALIAAIAAASFVYMVPAALFFSLVMMPLVLLILVVASPRSVLSVRSV
jgi:hypothetical protein